MPNYVDDDLALPADRVNRRSIPPGANPLAFDDADYHNAIKQCLEDVRDAVQADRVIAVNVKAYGATGDGSTDDITALNAAAASATNVDLWLPPGTYMVSAPIAKTSGRLRIHGQGATIKARSNFSSTGSYQGIVDAQNCDELIVDGVTIDGNRAVLGNGTFTDWLNFIHGVYTYQTTAVYLHNVTVQNFPSIGIIVRNATRCTFRRCRTTNGMFHGLCAQECENVAIVENRVEGTGDEGGPETNRGGIGISILDSLYVDVSGNHVSNSSDTGIKGQACSYVNCERNSIVDAGKDGIKWCTYDGHIAQEPVFVRVANNYVERINAWRPDGSALIIVDDYNGAFIGGNQLISGGTRVADAIRIVTLGLEGTLSNFIVEGNYGESIDGKGINAVDVTGLTIRGNRLDSNIEVGNSQGDLLIEGNVINNGGTRSTSDIGVFVYNIASGSVVIRNNMISEHVVGIETTAAGGATIDVISATQNVVKDCHQFGVRMESFTSAATVRLLDFSNNTLRDTCAGINTSSAIRIGTPNLTVSIAKIANNVIENLTANTIDYWLELTGTGTNKIALLDVTGSVVQSGVTNTTFVSGWTEASRYIGWQFTTAPNFGTWVRGDIVLKSNPSSGAEWGYICTASGSPGTWKNLNGIS